MATAMLILMIILLLAGYPLMVPLLAATLLAFLVFIPGMDPQVMVQQMIGGVKPTALIAVPLFIFAADIMTRGMTANRLLDLVMKFIGHVRGGLPITTAASCTLFGAVSGSTQATVVAMGSPLRPRLLRAGYSDSFSMALIINSSDIALLIPPSIGMIVYGVVSGTSVGELFIAGIGPGLLILFLFSVYCYFYARIKAIPTEEKSSWPERGKAFRKALFPLGFPVIVVGGIYAGYFSPTEAAAVSVAYAAVLEVFVFKVMKLKEIPELAVSTGMITAVVFILVAAGAAFSWVLSFQQVPSILINDVLNLDPSQPVMVLIAVCAAYFIGCMFVDPIVVILILTPIFAPVIHAAGIDPVLAGTLVTLQVAIGSATPPFGCDIFTAIAVFRRPYLEVIKGSPPFFFILFLATALLIMFPQIALFLRDLAFH